MDIELIEKRSYLRIYKNNGSTILTKLIKEYNDKLIFIIFYFFIKKLKSRLNAFNTLSYQIIIFFHLLEIQKLIINLL